MKRIPVVSFLLLALNTLIAGPSFEWRDGDRVAFVGGTFMEQEQEEGHIETMLTLTAPDRSVTFRNLGWSGDTVESHISPGVPARPKYVPNLFHYVDAWKPTVLLVNYGSMESFRGRAGLAEFVRNYNTLLDKLSGENRKIVLISPAPHEAVGGSFPDPSAHNENLALYVSAIARIARERGLVFINLYDSLKVAPGPGTPLTHNGVHFTAEGYKAVAVAMEKALGLSAKRVRAADYEKLRAAIRHKNKQWWFHYKPMNSEYVYTGGTRYQNEMGGVRHPMFSEVEAFARLAEEEDRFIAKLREQIARDERLTAMAPGAKTEFLPRESQVPDPEEERKTFQVAEGFEVNLFAADPLIAKPVQMAFDLKNRLWVATTTLYPQIQPGEEPSDKIIILEDKDGDGRADRTTVFADGLVIPTGVLPYRDGAFVFDDTTLLFLRDTDGDGRADRKEIVLSGFGTEDSHHKGHSLRWDHLGRIHFNVGVFLHNNIETAHGLVSHSGHWNAGIFAYHPTTGKLDVYLANSVPPNPWGHYWNRWGFDFHIDSSGQQGSNFILPTSQRTSSALPVPGGEGKLAGGEIVNGRHLPGEWQGNLIAAPFKENRVARWQFSDDGSGYSMKAMPPVIVSTDSAFRPVDERIGPDGAIYIADWYNPLIGHMQHHFRDAGRDFTHGRIWRVTAKGRALVSKPRFVGVTVAQLLEHLKAPEDYTRAQARRALAERDPRSVISALSSWVQNLDSKDRDYDHHRLEALWTYQAMGVVEPNLLLDVLRAKDPNARAAATVVLRNWLDRIESPLPILTRLVQDEHSRVRLQAVIALSYIPQVRAMEIAAIALDKPMDRYLEQALRNTAVALKSWWEPSLGEGTLFGGNGKHLEFVLHAAGTQASPKAILALMRAGKLAPENFEGAMRTLAQSASLKELEILFRHDFPPGQQAQAIAALAQAARERNVVPAAHWHKRVEQWLDQADESTRNEAFRLVGAWKIEGLRTALEQAARNPASDAQRQAAIDGLTALGQERTIQFLGTLTTSRHANAREAALSALVELNPALAATKTAHLLGENRPANEVSRMVRPFLQRKNGAEELAAALVKGKITSDNAKLALRAVQTAGRNDPPLLDALNAAAGINVESKTLSREEMERLVTEIAASGDPARGEKIFRKNELACFQCHAMASAGGILGPDLSAVGSGSQVDYLVESLLNPDKIIKDGFETVEVTTKDDEYILGIKVRENPGELVLKDATRNEIVIPTSAIKEKKDRRTSLMPPGLTAGLTHSEFVDLCRFLSELGKPGPYANNPQPVVRRWQTVAPATDNIGSADLAWMPVYSTVSGILPLEDISGQGREQSALVRCQFEVTTPGKIQFKLNSIAGLKLWVNGQPADLKEVTALDLPRGRHAAVFRVDLAQRKEGLRVEFDQVADSPGRFQLVSGK